MNTKGEDIKSRVRTGPGTEQKEIKYEKRYQEFWLEEEIMRLVKSRVRKRV